MYHQVVLSLGSNLSPRTEYLQRANAEIAKFPNTVISAASEIVETEPQDVPVEFVAMKFMNQVLLVQTELSADEFSIRMHAIEDVLGRVRGVKNGPRTIDIDMIDYDAIVRNDPALILPHPRANERAFVIEPWKAVVRKEAKQLRKQVSLSERERCSHAVCERLIARLSKEVHFICAYEALKTELDLTEFIAACKARGMEVVTPTCVEIAGKKDFLVDKASEIDLWVCPGLAFTEGGKRVGFGGGWYDRFLGLAKLSAKKIGVGYAFQCYSNLPQGPFDQLLDEVIFVGEPNK